MAELMNWRVINGDCVEELKELPANSFDAVVTDPPYALDFMGKSWDSFGGGKGFQSWCEDWSAECLRVLKPGGHLAAFGGTRTYHRMTCAIEDAGFEIRDSLHWLYGSGFPKSHNLHGEWEGWGTALKPAHEPIALARKPFPGTVASNVLEYGAGGINVDACRVTGADAKAGRTRHGGGIVGNGSSFELPDSHGEMPAGRWPPNVLLSGDAVGELDRQSGASRFFPYFKYQAKAGKRERPTVDGVSHPTVKPVELMRWLVRLVTPLGGLVLDPFGGTGTTAAACELEGFDSVLIEREAEYVKLISARMEVFADASGQAT